MAWRAEWDLGGGGGELAAVGYVLGENILRIGVS